MSAPVEGISNLTQPSRSYKPQDSGGSLPPLHHFASEAIVYNPSMSVSMGVKLDELPVNQYPCAVMPAEDFAKLARHVQIRAQGLPEPAVTIFLDLLQVNIVFFALHCDVIMNANHVCTCARGIWAVLVCHQALVEHPCVFAYVWCRCVCVCLCSAVRTSTGRTPPNVPC